ncbi:UDP-glycosyltransferase UGT5-like [Diprion similis]|uniref:UDP-glycosyltransferase UGT5-like n=1 Tax=Diprion similis TaxID=362088 RepID=UPI001EF83783|nr:UDP-glycosyltransferase UGT5-like [Diprion similis]
MESLIMLRLSSFFTLLVVLSIASPHQAYRILAVFPFNSVSHFAMSGRIAEELASHGHQVDVISHYPLKEPRPNYNDVVSLAGTMPFLKNNMTYKFGTEELAEDTLIHSIATKFGGDLCDLMDLPKFKQLIKNPPQDPPYDAVIIETFGAVCYLALGQHLRVPVVAVVTSPIWPWVNDMVANPEDPAYIPHVFSGLSGQLNFWQRLQNTLTLWKAKLSYTRYTAYQNDKIKKHFGPQAPSLDEVRRDVSLVLVNSHYSLNGIRPFTPAVVEVGGLHIRENGTPLQKDLKKWLDDSTDGFVLITFGSMLKLETFPRENLVAIYSSLAKLAPIRVVVKVVNATELVPGLPSNVLTLPWVSQMAVLQHKNIRAFMTHGGLMGTMEAIYCGVPMIGVPMFGDQPQNIELYAQKNMAVSVSRDELTEENLDAAFNAVLHDPSYMKAAKEMSAKFRDRPLSAVDTAMFWVEYIIRNGGASLRSPAMDLSWWQIALFDVYGALLLAAVLALYLLKVIVKKAERVVFGSDAEIKLRTKKNE